MPKRDPLLGAQHKREPEKVNRSRWASVSLALLLTVGGTALATSFLRDQHQATLPADEQSSRPLAKETIPASIKSAALTAQRAPPEPVDILLERLTDADSNDLEMGCMGVFTAGKKDILYVSGGTMIFRPDGKRIIAPISDGEFQAFAGDDATTNIESYRIRLAPRGVSEPGFDGHSVKAVLTISKGTKATSFDGTWGFGC